MVTQTRLNVTLYVHSLSCSFFQQDNARPESMQFLLVGHIKDKVYSYIFSAKIITNLCTEDDLEKSIQYVVFNFISRTSTYESRYESNASNFFQKL
jgi:hypothetical protein